jgi:P4 family phage/plasmid primase-like protien
MEMFKNAPTLFTYNGLPFDYDPDADFSWWADLVSDILGGDSERIRLLQQWFGYNMVSDVSQEKLMFFIGPPRSGKGTMTEALKSILGQEQVAATDMDDMAGSFGYEHLMGKLCVTVGDLKTSGHTNVERALQRLLNITGEDGVTVNMKGKPAIPHVHLSCRFTISMNLLPALRDNANAIMPRLSFLRFPNSYIGREDRGLKVKIKSRGQAIATWALAGLLDLRSSGRFIEPACDQDMVPQVKRLNSPMLAFVEDCCELGEEYTAAQFDIRNTYRAWCKGGCYSVESEDMMRQHICAVCPGVHYGVKAVMDSKVKTWIGIRVTEQAKKDYL